MSGFCSRPMPGRASQIRHVITLSKPCNDPAIPNNKSDVFRAGKNLPVVKRENPAVITNTGHNSVDPSSTGIFPDGNQKSHWMTSPVSQTRPSAGFTRRYCGLIRQGFSRKHDGKPAHPKLSAGTTAGISGKSTSSARTRASNGQNNVSTVLRSSLGGTGDDTGFTTVDQEILKHFVIRALGNSSAAKVRIRARSTEVTPSGDIDLARFFIHFIKHAKNLGLLRRSAVLNGAPARVKTHLCELQGRGPHIVIE